MAAKKHVFKCPLDGIVLSTWSAAEYPSLVAAHQRTHEPGAEPEKTPRKTTRLKESKKEETE